MITITLPPELEKIVTQRAHKQGTTPERIALDGLREKFLPTSDPVANTEHVPTEKGMREQFDAVYSKETSHLDPLFGEIQVRSLPQDEW